MKEGQAHLVDDINLVLRLHDRKSISIGVNVSHPSHRASTPTTPSPIHIPLHSSRDSTDRERPWTHSQEHLLSGDSSLADDLESVGLSSDGGENLGQD